MMTVSRLKTALREAMEQVYGELGTMWEWTPAQIAEIKALAQVYRSDAWLFPEKFRLIYAWRNVSPGVRSRRSCSLQSQRICAAGCIPTRWMRRRSRELEALLHDCPLTSQALQERALSASPHHPLIPECIAWISQEIEGQEAKWD